MPTFAGRLWLHVIVSILLFVPAMPLAAQMCAGSTNATANYTTGTIGNDAVAMHWETGLVWKRCRQGTLLNSDTSSCVNMPGFSREKTWNAWMQDYLPKPFASSGTWGVTSTGQTNRIVSGDWRLPYRNELAALTTGCASNPQINRTVFPSTPSASFWSGSPSAGTVTNAWWVGFLSGDVNTSTRATSLAARLVRGGLPFANLAASSEIHTQPNTTYAFPAFTLQAAPSGDAAPESWGGLRISGAGNPQFRIGGTVIWRTEGVVKSGDTITVRMTTGNAGTLRTATLELRSANTGGTNDAGSNAGNESAQLRTTSTVFRAIADRVCRVTPTGNGSNNGASWATAMTLHAALADDDPACDEIWVKRGVYTPGVNREDSFNIRRKVRVYGGFVGTETTLDQRNPLLYKTVLSGDIDNNDVRDEHGITRVWTDRRGNNSYQVVTINGSMPTPITAQTVVDGFVITAGHASGATLAELDRGGGMVCNAEGIGGQCSPTLQKLEFVGNSAQFLGGALYVSAKFKAVAEPVISFATFSGNAAYSGGALYIHVGGDEATQAAPRVLNSTFDGNHATYDGGAVVVAALGPDSDSRPASDAPVRGAFQLVLAEPKFFNVTFSGNTADFSGGAMHNSAFGEGNVVPYIYQATFTGNTAKFGGAVANATEQNGWVLSYFYNSLLWGNQADMYGNQIYQVKPGAFSIIDYSILQGGSSGIYGNAPAAFTEGAGNLNADPLLNPLTRNGGYTRTHMPGIGSPAVDAGGSESCTSIDQRGVQRPQGAACDIGAVEQKAGEGASIEDEIFSNGFE